MRAGGGRGRSVHAWAGGRAGVRVRRVGGGGVVHMPVVCGGGQASGGDGRQGDSMRNTMYACVCIQALLDFVVTAFDVQLLFAS